MEILIKKPQNAFIKGRQILDSILNANEGLDGWLKSKNPRLLCKLIMEKTYNHINWKFFLYLLARCNFGKKWLRWIEFCISIIHFSILVIGLLVGFFNSSHGLRQRDLFSPLLFLFIMETLSKMIKVLVEGGFLHGFSLGKSAYGCLNIFHRLLWCKSQAYSISKGFTSLL